MLGMRGRNSAPGGGTYTAFGGSNTCDHPPQKVGYQTLVFQELRRRGLVSEHQNSCIHAMGPAFAASCMPYFVSKNTTFATLEYVPNMGVQTQLHADHLGLLLTRLQRRHVNVALVNIVPPDSRMRHFGDAHARVSSLARSLSVPVITVEYRNDTSMWKREERVVRHITDEAQRTVAARVVSVLVEQQSWRRRGRSTASAASIASQASCLFGRDLARARVLDSSGFELRPEADHKGAQSVRRRSAAEAGPRAQLGWSRSPPLAPTRRRCAWAPAYPRPQGFACSASPSRPRVQAFLASSPSPRTPRCEYAFAGFRRRSSPRLQWSKATGDRWIT